MEISVKRVFNRHGNKTKSGLYTISIRITIDRVAKYYNPGIPKLEDKFWRDRADSWIKDSHPNAFEFNNLIRNKLDKTNNRIMKLKLEERPVTFKNIFEVLLNHRECKTFNEYIADYRASLKTMHFNLGLNPRFFFEKISFSC